MTVKLLVSALLVFGCVAPAWAWTEVYSWSASSGATSYRVERTTDNGTTWTQIGSPTTPTFTYTGTEAGLTLFRISACNAITCVVRGGDGLWHNEVWQNPLAPSNLLAQ